MHRKLHTEHGDGTIENMSRDRQIKLTFATSLDFSFNYRETSEEKKQALIEHSPKKLYDKIQSECYDTKNDRYFTRDEAKNLARDYKKMFMEFVEDYKNNDSSELEQKINSEDILLNWEKCLNNAWQNSSTKQEKEDTVMNYHSVNLYTELANIGYTTTQAIEMSKGYRQTWFKYAKEAFEL